MPLTTLKQLYIEQLRDLHSAERQAQTIFPRIATATQNNDLNACFDECNKGSKVRQERLEAIIRGHGAEPTGHKCEAMAGIIREAEENLGERADIAVRDAALIASVNRIAHYGIAGYGTVKAFAKELGLKDDAKLLDDCLDEAGASDKRVTKIAEGGMLSSGVNKEAKK